MNRCCFFASLFGLFGCEKQASAMSPVTVNVVAQAHESMDELVEAIRLHLEQNNKTI